MAVPGGGKYEVARSGGKCAVCGGDILPEQKFMAALVENPQGFARTDCCLLCWEKFDRSGALAFWQTALPKTEAKRKLFVDDAVLCELFERLAQVTEPAKVNFRFLLGMILMRKRLLVYETTRVEDGKEIWTVRPRGREDRLEMTNPKLDEQQMLEVSQQLGEILNEEL